MDDGVDEMGVSAVVPDGVGHARMLVGIGWTLRDSVFAPLVVPVLSLSSDKIDTSYIAALMLTVMYDCSSSE